MEVMHDDLKPAPTPAKPIYPNGGGLVQYGLNRWRETGPLPGGHSKFFPPYWRDFSAESQPYNQNLSVRPPK